MTSDQRQRRREGSRRAQAARDRRTEARQRRGLRNKLYISVGVILAIASAIGAFVFFSDDDSDVVTVVAPGPVPVQKKGPGQLARAPICKFSFLSVELPNQVKCKIETTDVALKGQTVSSSYKPALLTNGLKIQVPPFIESEDTIIVDTRTIEYIKKI